MTAASLTGRSRVSLLRGPTLVHEMTGLRDALGGGPRLFIKRDDAIPFAFGGNKIRKLEYVMQDAIDAGADTLVTLGGIQSNHARATAAVAAKHGMRCSIIANGAPQEKPTANALLNQLLGADIVCIPSRNERADALRDTISRLADEGRRPFAIPLGASTSVGALGFVAAIDELAGQRPLPDAIVHATSSGGTQAGILAGLAMLGASTRVIGVSADDPAAAVASTVRDIVRGIAGLADYDEQIEVDDAWIGDGYGIPTDASREAQLLLARAEGIFVDHTYSAKALASLIARVRAGEFTATDNVLFWHTGGQIGLFA